MLKSPILIGIKANKNLTGEFLYVKLEFSIIIPFNIEISYEVFRISLSIKFAVLSMKS